LSGQVADASTTLPIPSAVVSDMVRDLSANRAAERRHGGIWEVRSQTIGLGGWVSVACLLVPCDPALAVARLHVSAPGYRSRDLEPQPGPITLSRSALN